MLEQAEKLFLVRFDKRLTSAKTRLELPYFEADVSLHLTCVGMSQFDELSPGLSTVVIL